MDLSLTSTRQLKRFARKIVVVKPVVQELRIIAWKSRNSWAA